MHTKPDLIARLMSNVPYVLQWMIVAVVSQISCLWSRCQRPSLNPAPAAVWATCHSTGLPSPTAHHAYHKQQYWTLNHIVHVLTLSKCVFSIPVNKPTFLSPQSVHHEVQESHRLQSQSTIYNVQINDGVIQ